MAFERSTKHASGALRRWRVPLLAALALTVSGCAIAGSTLGDVYEDARRQPIPPDAIIVGSGFFIQPSLVLTSAHVLAGCQSFTVQSPTIGVMSARAGAVLTERDAAILKVDGASLDFLPVASVPARGRLAIYGYPAERAGDQEPRRYVASSHSLTGDALLLWGADVPAGLSGGPVVDDNGQAVGILTGRVNNGGNRELLASPLSALRGDIGDAMMSAVSGKPASARATVKVRCK